jgi:glycosyltransferase involved in cell wall biosynthesis
VDDLRPIIAEAAVCVVPLRLGSGTRLKILEAAAMGKAVVSTSLGAEGLDLCDGHEILLADDSQHFAEAVAGLLRDRARAASLGAAARRAVEEKYSIAALQMHLRHALAGLPGSAESAMARAGGGR